MTEKKITRKVISPSKKDNVVNKKAFVKDAEETSRQTDEVQKGTEAVKTKRTCFFHQSKTEPSFTDIVVLRKYTTDRAKIVSRAKNSLCSKHQRAIAKQIKYARHLALLPFVPKV